MSEMQNEDRKNLIFVYKTDDLNPNDFVQIGNNIKMRNPGIETIVINDDNPDRMAVKNAASAPSLVVSQRALRKFQPQRGKIYAGRAVNKAAQSRRLRDHGIAAPISRVFSVKDIYSEEEFGPYVMVKVTNLALASRGRGIRLMQTRSLPKYAKELRQLEQRTRSPVLIQSFIDSGKRPSTYRVLTLFGAALYIKKRTLTKPIDIPVLEMDFVLSQGMATNREHGKGVADTELVKEDDIATLAAEAAAAFPESPIIGVDILRQGETGKPYVIEMNIGNTWHFSSKTPGRFRGKVLSDFFNSWEVAAEILVEKVLAEAE